MPVSNITKPIVFRIDEYAAWRKFAPGIDWLEHTAKYSRNNKEISVRYKIENEEQRKRIWTILIEFDKFWTGLVP